MNLPLSYARCAGEYQVHWMTGTKPCARRDQCARYVARQWDEVTGRAATHTTPSCVDEGHLSAFISVDEVANTEDGE